MKAALSALAIRLALFAAVPAGAGAGDIRRERVQFAPGSSQSTQTARLKGYASAEYTLGAEAGQRLTIVFKASSRMAFFNVLEPGNPTAIFIGETAEDPNRFEGTLAKSGDYVVQVFQMRAGARRGEAFQYTISFKIDGKVALDAPVKGDFADSLAGGPDVWQVTGVPAGDRLHIRKAPSPKAAIVASVDNGTALRNRGCRIVSGQRWCRVEGEPHPSAAGWVAGRYLREGAPVSGSGAAPAPAGLDLAAECRRLAAVDFATRPARIRTSAIGPGPEGFLVDATADLGREGVKPFACRFDRTGRYLGIMSKVDEGRL